MKNNFNHCQRFLQIMFILYSLCDQVLPVRRVNLRAVSNTSGEDDDTSSLYCREGQYLSDKSELCFPCHNNTYMPARHHRAHGCLPCDQIKSPREAIDVQCTLVSNTVLGCAPTFFKRITSERTREFVCLKCRDCSEESTPKFVGRPCQGEQDTFCCDAPGMEVVEGKCVHPTHTIKTCEPGFYATVIKRSHSERSEIVCRPCTDCSAIGNITDNAIITKFEAKPCGPYADTVCCSSPDVNTTINPQSGLIVCENSIHEERSTSATQIHADTGSETTRNNSQAHNMRNNVQTATCDSKTYTAVIAILAVFLALFMCSTIVLAIRYRRLYGHQQGPVISAALRRRTSLLDNIEEGDEEDEL